jgi:hypothetical protein
VATQLFGHPSRERHLQALDDRPEIFSIADHTGSGSTRISRRLTEWQFGRIVVSHAKEIAGHPEGF